MDIFDNIKNGVYETKLPRPKKPSQRPILEKNHTVNEVMSYVRKLERYEDQLEEYKGCIVLYSKDKNRLRDIFQQEAFAWVGLENHPKRFRAWEIAKDNSSSEIEIVENLNELADLILN